MNNKKKVVTSVVALCAMSAAVAGSTLAAPQNSRFYARSGRVVEREAHPEINRAISNLTQAKTNAQNAARDFGGHRARAAKLIDQAIAELKLAKQYDNRH